MYPILIEWGSFILPAWHTFFVLGAIAAYILFVQSKRWFYPDLSDWEIGNIYAFGYLGGYFGARFFSILNEQSDVDGFLGFLAALFSLGPMTFYGGFIGVALTVFLYCRLQKLSISKISDLGLLAGMLGLAYGRVGCFLNGDDYGRAVPESLENSWWAVKFTNLNDSVARYPTQLIETTFSIFLVAVLLFNFKKIVDHNRSGLVAAIGAMIYSFYRFFAEYLRGDERGWWVEDVISTSQGLSIIIFLVAALSIFMIIKRSGSIK